MQSHAVFVNIARGSVIDEAALINTLKQNKIFAAGLDVYSKEPLQESELLTCRMLLLCLMWVLQLEKPVKNGRAGLSELGTGSRRPNSTVSG